MTSALCMFLFVTPFNGNLFIHHLAAHRTEPHGGVGSSVVEVGAMVCLHYRLFLLFIPDDNPSVLPAEPEFVCLIDPCRWIPAGWRQTFLDRRSTPLIQLEDDDTAFDRHSPGSPFKQSHWTAQRNNHDGGAPCFTMRLCLPDFVWSWKLRTRPHWRIRDQTLWFPKTPYYLWHNELRLLPGEVRAAALSDF